MPIIRAYQLASTPEMLLLCMHCVALCTCVAPPPPLRPPSCLNCSQQASTSSRCASVERPRHDNQGVHAPVF